MSLYSQLFSSLAQTGYSSSLEFGAVASGRVVNKVMIEVEDLDWSA